MAQAGKPKLSSRAKRLLEKQRESGMAFAAAALGGDADVVDDAWLAMTFEARKLLLYDLANLRDENALRWFWGRRELMMPELAADVMNLRDELRALWIGRKLLDAQNILNRWLRWLPSKDHAQAFPVLAIAETPTDYMPFTCSLEARRLVPNHLSLRSTLIQGVFEQWGHFRFCANPNCAAPYFIAKRRDQTVCNAEACKAEKQRQHALKWWRENRTKESKTATKNRGNSKNNRRGAAKDGSRKTR
jgi:hypothetical protein